MVCECLRKSISILSGQVSAYASTTGQPISKVGNKQIPPHKRNGSTKKVGVNKKVYKKPPNNTATVKWSVAVHLCQLFATFRNIKIIFVLSWCVLDISRLLIHFPFHSLHPVRNLLIFKFLYKVLPAHTDGIWRGRSLRSTRRKFTIYLRSYNDARPPSRYQVLG